MAFISKINYDSYFNLNKEVASMKKTRCTPCSGSGRVMGGGMMMADCDICDGEGKIRFVEDEIDFLTIKQTEGYQKAKKRLQSKSPDLSDEKAEELLDEAFEKEKPETKSGRKRKTDDKT